MQEVIGPAFSRPADDAGPVLWPERSCKDRRMRNLIVPVLASALLTALTVHLMTELISRLTFDPVADISVMVGMSAVMVTLFPFTALCLHRMRAAFRSNPVKAAPPGGG